jgi:hypothetical protein
MSAPDDCSQNVDPLKLVREGTTQSARSPEALDPVYAPVNERGVAHNLVFARSYAALLRYFDATDTQAGDWTPFFTSDISALMAVPAVEDIDAYTSRTQEWFDYLNDMENQSKTADLKDRFSYLYASVASLARRVDEVKQALPGDSGLHVTLQNLIRTQLAPAFTRLIAYYKGANALGLVSAVAPDVQVLRARAVTFESVMSATPAAALSSDWSGGQAWAGYVGGINPDASVYGSAAGVFARINHCSTHTLFKSCFDQFVRVFARLVADAQRALERTLTDSDTHEPHDTLFLAFLRLLEYARESANTLTKRHLDFYYRDVLGLKEKTAAPGHVHLLAELAKQTTSRRFESGEVFKAGKDASGKDAFFANTADFVANQGKVSALKTLYRHGGECVAGTMLHKGRLFASSVADSDDGLGAPPRSADGSWHPFFSKVYADGSLTHIHMPEAEVGFAIASHYLLMAEGTRWISAELKVSGYTGRVANPFWTNVGDVDLADEITCLVSTEKGWLKKRPSLFVPIEGAFYAAIEIDGGDPAIVPYSPKVHGYNFQTDQPMLLVVLNQDDTRPYVYSAFKGVAVSSVALRVSVNDLKTLAASNDFGPLDTSKPFQPFGSSPVAGSSLVVGSKEVFQKNLSYARIAMNWLTAPTVYPSTGSLPTVSLDVLQAAQWEVTSNASLPVNRTVYGLSADLDKPAVDEADFTPDVLYSTQSRHGFVKLRLNGNFGQDAYQADLIKYLRKDSATDPGSRPPTGPTASSLSMGYVARTTLALDSARRDSYERRAGRFFHLTPFGTAEQHPYLNRKGKAFLFPQFEFERTDGNVTQAFTSEAEFYVGVSGLVPPQSLSLLFQVVDGTANPLVKKPAPHVAWAYLKQNEWIELEKTAVQDATAGLLNSGIVTLSVPSDATKDNTAMPSGVVWIKAAVESRSDAVCRLLRVAAQAMEAAFADRGNAPEFAATPLPAGTIARLDMPDAAVKKIAQPFASFGGRGAEQSRAFFTRVSERLRHKNRAIDLWDYERLILEAFPQVYKVKCLNHTCYEPTESTAEGCATGRSRGGIYRELAPGHVTIVAIPNLQTQNVRDPLKPFTSLGVLEDIRRFVTTFGSCFAQLHVENPQFEEVRVRLSLRLRNGFDETYYQNLLKQAITRFLSPWAFAEGGVPSFGGTIYKSVLINFVEEQPYVDYVTNVELFHDIDGVPGTVDLDQVRGSRAVSMLVSVPAPRHEIVLITPAQDAPLGENCGCDS